MVRCKIWRYPGALDHREGFSDYMLHIDPTLDIWPRRENCKQSGIRVPSWHRFVFDAEETDRILGRYPSGTESRFPGYQVSRLCMNSGPAPQEPLLYTSKTVKQLFWGTGHRMLQPVQWVEKNQNLWRIKRKSDFFFYCSCCLLFSRILKNVSSRIRSRRTRDVSVSGICWNPFA